MLPIEQVLERFGAISRVPDEELERYRGMCLTAKAFVEKRIRPEVDLGCEVDCGRLCMAAAAHACCDYLMTAGRGAAMSEEIRVGDVTLRSGRFGEAQSQNGIELREYFMAQAADLMLPGFTALQGVGEI